MIDVPDPVGKRARNVSVTGLGGHQEQAIAAVGKLDDEDKVLIGRRRGSHMRVGFALQMVTARYLGCFLTDPLDVPNEVLDVVAGQLGIADPSCVKRYTEREKTRLDHAWEIQKVFGLRDFASCEAELTAKVDARWRMAKTPARRSAPC